MAYNSCCGNFSSRSFGGYLQYPISSCGSSYPSNLLYRAELQTPITHQLDSPLYSGCQETFDEPSCPSSYELSSPCQRYCHGPKSSAFFRPSVGFGSRGFQSFGCVSPSLGFGSSGFPSVGCGPRPFSSLDCRSNFYRPAYFSSKRCQSVSYQPACGSVFY